MRKIPLPDEAVAARYEAGATQKELAAEYGVSARTIERAIWRVLGEERCREIGSERIAAANRRDRSGVPRPPEVREKIAAAQRGPKNHRWQGGRKVALMRLRSLAKHKRWRQAILKQDHYTCRLCGCEGRHLHAHHIRRFSRYPLGRTALWNGVALCLSCHRAIERPEGAVVAFTATNLERSGGHLALSIPLRSAMELFEAWDTGQVFRVTIERVPASKSQF